MRAHPERDTEACKLERVRAQNTTTVLLQLCTLRKDNHKPYDIDGDPTWAWAVERLSHALAHSQPQSALVRLPHVLVALLKLGGGRLDKLPPLSAYGDTRRCVHRNRDLTPCDILEDHVYMRLYLWCAPPLAYGPHALPNTRARRDAQGVIESPDDAWLTDAAQAALPAVVTLGAKATTIRDACDGLQCLFITMAARRAAREAREKGISALV